MNSTGLSYSALISRNHDFAKGLPTVAVFEAYLDESITEEHRFFTVGGFIGHDLAWRSLESTWLASLPSYLRYFHTSDCFTANDQFDGVGEPERKALLDQLTENICNCDIRLVACCIPVGPYKRLAPRPKVNAFLGNRYLAGFSDIIRMACEYAISPLPPEIPEQSAHVCHFWWENNEYTDGAKKLIRQMRDNKSLYWRIAIGTETSGCKEGPGKIDLLQVADFGAFFGAKKLSNAPAGKIPWQPYFERLEKAGRILKLVGVTAKELRIFHKNQFGAHEE